MKFKKIIEAMEAMLEQGVERAKVELEFFHSCDAAGVPRITVYYPTGMEGWYEMVSAVLLTDRTDHREFWYYYSPRTGDMYVTPLAGGQYQTLEQWDAEARLVVDTPQGSTNMDLAKRELKYREQLVLASFPEGVSGKQP